MSINRRDTFLEWR